MKLSNLAYLTLALTTAMESALALPIPESQPALDTRSIKAANSKAFGASKGNAQAKIIAPSRSAGSAKAPKAGTQKSAGPSQPARKKKAQGSPPPPSTDKTTKGTTTRPCKRGAATADGNCVIAMEDSDDWSKQGSLGAQSAQLLPAAGSSGIDPKGKGKAKAENQDVSEPDTPGENVQAGSASHSEQTQSSSSRIKNWFSGSKKSTPKVPDHGPLLPMYELPKTKPDGYTDGDWESHKLAVSEHQRQLRKDDAERAQNEFTDKDSRRKTAIACGTFLTACLVMAGTLHKDFQGRSFEDEEYVREKRAYVELQYVADR